MRCSPTTRQIQYDFDKVFEDGIEGRKESRASKTTNRIALSPHLLIKLNNIETWSLLDTGSQITAISETFYEKVKQNSKILELPVSNVTVSTAIGKKGIAVKKQVKVEIEIDTYKSYFVFLIIPHLSSEVVLGNDWNLANGSIINYNNKTIQIKENIISRALVMFEFNTSEKILTTNEGDNIAIYIINIDKRKSNINEDNEIIIENINREFTKEIQSININESKQYLDVEEDFENYKISQINESNEQVLSEELDSLACKLTSLNVQQKEIVLKLIKEKQQLFSNKPGCARGYQHEIRLIKQHVIIKKNVFCALNATRKSKGKN